MINAADTAWVPYQLGPGLADDTWTGILLRRLYGGLVRQKNVAGTLMQVVVTMGPSWRRVGALGL